MAGAFAEAYVQISPKMDDFAGALKRALSGLRNVEIPVSLKFDPGKIQSQLADLTKAQTVNITANADAGKAKTILDGLDDPRQSVVTAVADAQKATSLLNGLDKPHQSVVSAVADVGKATVALGDLAKPIAPVIEPVVDVSKAQAAFDDLDKPLEVPVIPRLDDAPTKRALSDLQRALHVNLDVSVSGRARAEIADLTRTDTKIIEVEYVSKGSPDPYEPLTKGGTAAGEKAGKNITAGMGAAIGAGMKGPAALLIGGLGLKAVVESGGEFQVAMAKIQVQTGATATEMGKVDALTLQLGKDQKLGAASAGDAATAIQVLTKGQFSLKEAMDVSRNALQLSIVAQESAEVAAGQLATAMAQLKVPVGDAAKVVDTLAAADLKGVIGDAKDYATAIQYAGTQWTQSFRDKAPLENLYDLNTALVTLDNQAGIVGSHGGEVIRRTLLDMTGPTDKAAKGIANLTVQFQKNGGVLRDGGNIFFNAAGQMRPLPEALGNINTAMTDLGGNALAEQQRLEPIFTTLGKEGVNLLRQGLPAWDETEQAVRRLGITSQLSDAYATGLKGAFSGLSGALETTAIQTAKAISPLLIPAISGLGTLISGLGVIIPPVVAGIQTLFGALGNWAPVKAAADAFDRFKDAIGSIFDKPTTTGSWMTDQFLASQTAADKLKYAIGRIRDEFPALDRIATIFETKILPAIKAVSSFITETLIPTIGKISDKVREISGGIIDFFGKWDLKAKLAAAALAGVAAGLVAVTVVLPTFTAAVTGAGIALGIITSPVFLIVAGITALAIGLKIAYDNIGPFRTAVDAVWQTIVKLPGPTWLAVAAIGALGVAVLVATGPFGLVATAVLGLVAAITLLRNNQGVRDFIASFAGFTGITTIIDGVKQAIRGIGEVVSGTVRTIKSLLSGDWAGAWEGAKKGVQGLKDILVGIGKITFGPLVGAIRAIGSAFDLPKGAVGALKAALLLLGAVTFGPLVGAIGAIARAVASPKQALNDLLGLLKAVGRVFTATVNVTIGGLSNLQKAANLIASIGGVKITNNSTPVKPGIVAGSYGTTTTTKASGQTSGRAAGGPVEAGTPYIVGEEGPELFFPRISGEIFTNKDSARILEQAKKKSFDAAGIIAKVLTRNPSNITGSPTDMVLGALTSSFTAATDAVTGMGDAADNSRGAVSDFAAATDTTAVAITGAGEAAIDMGAAFAAGGDGIVTNVGVFQNGVANIIGVTQDGATNAAGQIVATATDASENIWTVIDASTLAANAAAATVAAGATSAAGTTTGAADQFAENIIQVGSDIGTGLTNTLGDGSPLDGAIDGLSTGLDVLGDAADPSLVGAFTGLTTTVKGPVLSAFDELVAKIGGIGTGGTKPGVVTALDANGNPVPVDYIVPPPIPDITDPLPANADWGAFVYGGTPNPFASANAGPAQQASGGGGTGNGVNTGANPSTPANNSYVNPNNNPVAAVVAAATAAAAAVFGGKKAAGGPVLRSTPYLVGERGPELFVPHLDGVIVPNGSRYGGGDLGAKLDTLIELIGRAGLDRPNLNVDVNTEIPGWQIDTLVEILADRIDERLARGR